ncbi:hypothetical protein HKCCE4037_18670, partial [Rhodobacterales bacterium HKCCE4037]|nr:hypothetical protein [Rhodobacterales bacterium HKCCE4037]
MDHATYTRITEDLRRQIDERLYVRARSFPGAVRKAGRLLPANARAAALDLVAMESRLTHPKLAARTDPATVHAAADTVRTALA